MIVKSISISEEADAVIEALKDEELNFNFSAFVTNALISYRKNEIENTDKIKQEIKKLELKNEEMDILKEKTGIEIENLRDKLIKLEAQKMKVDEEKSIEEKRKNLQKNINYKSWKSLFNEEYIISDEDLDKLCIEYEEAYKNEIFHNIFEFMDKIIKPKYPRKLIFNGA